MLSYIKIIFWMFLAGLKSTLTRVKMVAGGCQVIRLPAFLRLETHICSPAETTIRKQDYIIIERGTINQLLEGFYRLV